MLKWFLKFIIGRLFSVRVIGLNNYHKAGKRAVIVANHLSFLDGILMALFLPGSHIFAINKFITEKWYFKLFASCVTALPIDPANPMALKAMIGEVMKNKKLVIFPEGRITVTGSLMKVYEGPGMVADKTKANVLPIRIDGAQYTYFSRLKGKVKLRWFPKITLTILPPEVLGISKDIEGRQRRHMAGLKLYDIMSKMMFDSSNYNQTLFQSVMDQANIHGHRHVIMEDISRKPLNYNKFFNRIFVLKRKLFPVITCKQYTGILLPNVTNAMVTFFAVQACKSVPAMLNFTMGVKNIIFCCKAAEIKVVLTSKTFIEMANLIQLVEAFRGEGIAVYYLEDIAKSVGTFDKVLGVWNRLTYKDFTDPNSPAVVLFTSGSEGKPKGVVLSHCNILANCAQLAARVDFGPTDIVFNALPIFHSFGLTGGSLLPLVSGIKIFFYPSPLHYRIVPEMVYDVNATIMFGTDTFLFGYARFAHPYNFYSVRYVFAGAEKLKDETRKLWVDKYGVRIFEGYGTTETSPVISTNTPMHSKPGSVGRLLPGITYELQKVPGIEIGGRLTVYGPNIMKGYLLNDFPGVIQETYNNGHNTGDIVSIDEEGYIIFQGRAKRFAKIAGEMVSLAAVEDYIHEIWPDNKHAVVAIPSAKKGEVLVLITDYAKATREEIARYIKKEGISDLCIPRLIKAVPKLPLLGSGKVDYVAAQNLVAEQLHD